MSDLTIRINEGGPTADKAPDIFEKLENLIKTQLSTEEKPLDDVLAAFGSPIVSVGILDAGDITATVLGSQRNKSGESFDNDTLFQAASISKAITALAVIKLCQKGELDLDVPISKYLSSVSLIFYNGFFRSFL